MRRTGSIQLAVDLLLAAGLALALAVVFGLDLGSRRAPPPEDKGSIEVVEVREEVETEPDPQPPKKLRLGVTPLLAEVTVLDDMGQLLDTLGQGYQYERFSLDGLADPDKLSRYDVVFLTCSTVPSSWVHQQLGQSARPGFVEVAIDPALQNRINESIRRFVGEGGTLYASDMHFDFVAMAFPDLVDQAKNKRAAKTEHLRADVLDPGLRDLLGEHMDLRFDLDGWYPGAFINKGQEMTTYLRGTYSTMDGGQDTAPLLVKIPVGQGTVIFTSFHNARQNSEAEIKLLRYLVFSAVTADVERRVTKTMLQGGFKKQKQNLFSASQGEPSATQSYRNEQAGHLRFVLGFDNLGARLRLTVEGPDGKQHEKEATSTFTIDVPDAAVGDWTYTVTAIKLPNENFAYNLTIGQK